MELAFGILFIVVVVIGNIKQATVKEQPKDIKIPVLETKKQFTPGWWNWQTQRTARDIDNISDEGRYIGNDIVVRCKFGERFKIPTPSEISKERRVETIITHL